MINVNTFWDIEGYFYTKEGKTCRKALRIKTQDAQKNPDLLVIMMNPGSSKPEGSFDYKSIKKELLNDWVKTEPDPTQLKIKKYMLDNSFHFACILNLSDICNQFSYELNSTIINYSNFNSVDSAKQFIKENAGDAKKCILAWGCKSIFKSQIENAKQALFEINQFEISGVNQTSDSKALYYYHPKVRHLDWNMSLVEIDLGNSLS